MIIFGSIWIFNIWIYCCRCTNSTEKTAIQWTSEIKANGIEKCKSNCWTGDSRPCQTRTNQSEQSTTSCCHTTKRKSQCWCSINQQLIKKCFNKWNGINMKKFCIFFSTNICSQRLFSVHDKILCFVKNKWWFWRNILILGRFRSIHETWCSFQRCNSNCASNFLKNYFIFGKFTAGHIRFVTCLQWETIAFYLQTDKIPNRLKRQFRIVFSILFGRSSHLIFTSFS